MQSATHAGPRACPAAIFHHHALGLLLPFDVGVQRLAPGRRDLERIWVWVMERLPRRRPRPVGKVETPSPVGRLFEVKSRADGATSQQAVAYAETGLLPG